MAIAVSHSYKTECTSNICSGGGGLNFVQESKQCAGPQVVLLPRCTDVANTCKYHTCSCGFVRVRAVEVEDSRSCRASPFDDTVTSGT